MIIFSLSVGEWEDEDDSDPEVEFSSFEERENVSSSCYNFLLLSF